MKNKYKIAQYKIYSDFYTGLAIAWFSSGVIAVLISKNVNTQDLLFTFECLVFTVISLFSAVEYKRRI